MHTNTRSPPDKSNEFNNYFCLWAPNMFFEYVPLMFVTLYPKQFCSSEPKNLPSSKQILSRVVELWSSLFICFHPFSSGNKLVEIVKSSNSWTNSSLNRMVSFTQGSLWLLGADCETTLTASFSTAWKSVRCSRYMMGHSQEAFCVPDSENTRPTQGNTLTCHIKGHPVITQLERQPECAVPQWFPWHLLYRSNNGEGGLALTYDTSTAIRGAKRIGDYTAFTISPHWKMLKWGLLSLHRDELTQMVSPTSYVMCSIFL